MERGASVLISFVFQVFVAVFQNYIDALRGTSGSSQNEYSPTVVNHTDSIRINAATHQRPDLCFVALFARFNKKQLKGGFDLLMTTVASKRERGVTVAIFRTGITASVKQHCCAFSVALRARRQERGHAMLVRSTYVSTGTEQKLDGLAGSTL